MTNQTAIDKERLAAFADGELSPEASAEVVMHLADHPEDQAYVDELMTSKEVLAAAFATPLHEPVPPAIHDAIMGTRETVQVIPFHSKPAVRTLAGLAIAASVALAVIALPQLSGMQPSDGRLAIGTVRNGSALDSMLDTLPSGTPTALGEDREVMILATLPVESGFCRELEVIDAPANRVDLGIACRQDALWRIEVTLSEPLSATGSEDGFVAASGTEVQSLQLFLDRLGAGMALDPMAEAAAIDEGWVR